MLLLLLLLLTALRDGESARLVPCSSKYVCAADPVASACLDKVAFRYECHEAAQRYGSAQTLPLLLLLHELTLLELLLLPLSSL